MTIFCALAGVGNRRAAWEVASAKYIARTQQVFSPPDWIITEVFGLGVSGFADAWQLGRSIKHEM